MPDPKLAELRAMTDEELVRAHDARIAGADAGWVIFRDELERREGTRRDKTIAGYTRSIFWLTVIIAIATLVNLWVFWMSTKGWIV